MSSDSFSDNLSYLTTGTMFFALTSPTLQQIAKGVNNRFTGFFSQVP